MKLVEVAVMILTRPLPRERGHSAGVASSGRAAPPDVARPFLSLRFRQPVRVGCLDDQDQPYIANWVNPAVLKANFREAEQHFGVWISPFAAKGSRDQGSNKRSGIRNFCVDKHQKCHGHSSGGFGRVISWSHRLRQSALSLAVLAQSIVLRDVVWVAPRTDRSRRRRG